MTAHAPRPRIDASMLVSPARTPRATGRPAQGSAAMTLRARAYLAICAARHLLLGVLCLGRPADFTSPSFEGTRSLLWFLPIGDDHMLMLWGATFIAAGLTAAAVALAGDHAAARRALTGSVIVTALWIGGLAWPVLAWHATGWPWVIVWVSLAAKDVTVLCDPLRDPVGEHLDDDVAAPDLRE